MRYDIQYHTIVLFTKVGGAKVSGVQSGCAKMCGPPRGSLRRHLQVLGYVRPGHHTRRFLHSKLLAPIAGVPSTVRSTPCRVR